MQEQDNFQPYDFSESQDEAVVTKRNTLTPEELDRAFLLLQKLFPTSHLEQVVTGLDRFVNQPPIPPRPLNFRPFPQSQNYQTYGNNQLNDRQIRPIRQIPVQMQQPIRQRRDQNQNRYPRQSEDNEKIAMKKIALRFVEVGYSKEDIKHYYPIYYERYHKIVTRIVRGIFSDLLRIVKSINKVDKRKSLQQNEKFTVLNQLVSAHKWMGNKSPRALHTFLKMIRFKFQNMEARAVKPRSDDRVFPLPDQDYLQLFRVIAQRVADNQVNISDIFTPKNLVEDVEINKNLGKRVVSSDFMMARFAYDQQEKISLIFLKEQTIQKTFEYLQIATKDYMNWNIQKIQMCLQGVLNKSIKSLKKNTKGLIISGLLGHGFIKDDLGKKIMQKGLLQLKQQLINYYLGRNSSQQSLEKTLGLINSFLSEQRELWIKNLKNDCQALQKEMKNNKKMKKEVVERPQKQSIQTEGSYIQQTNYCENDQELINDFIR